jgi:SOS-response transcriptional repressor LexA
VVIVVENDFQVRRYKKEKGQPVRFISENKKQQHLFPPIIEGDGTEVQVWGIVTKILVDPRTVYGNARLS